MAFDDVEGQASEGCVMASVVWQVLVKGEVVLERPTREEAKQARRELRDTPRATIRRLVKP
jgi:uncharacterized lipoprotein YmbA